MLELDALKAGVEWRSSTTSQLDGLPHFFYFFSIRVFVKFAPSDINACEDNDNNVPYDYTAYKDLNIWGRLLNLIRGAKLVCD